LPVFTLGGQAGRLFDPLAYTKTFAMLASALLAVTLAPVLMVALLKGRIRTVDENPVARLLRAGYRPLAAWAVQHHKLVVCAAIVLMLATVPIYQKLGSEFMPPLDEGSLLLMPTTFPGISIEQARQVLTAQHQVVMSFPEVASVHGKAGRAETATDPAQLDMNESVVLLKQKSEWPQRSVKRWHTDVAPHWMSPLLRTIWPDQHRWTMDELTREMARALQVPGYQMAIAPPIRTRIDMLTTGVRTPVGIKIFGDDLREIERLSVELEGLLRSVPGTRSTFAERQTGREYVDIIPDRAEIARYGLNVVDLNNFVEAAIGGMPVTTIVDGRARYSVNVRIGADYRSDPEALRSLLVPVQAVPGIALPTIGSSGQGSSAAPSNASATGSAMGDMNMGGTSPSATSTQPVMGGGSGDNDWVTLFGQSGTAVPLGSLAEVKVVSGPPMIKNENGLLVGYVFADIETAQRDLGGWVEDARRIVAEEFTLPAGYRLEWTGQYEFMAETTQRLRVMIPLTLVLIVALLYLALRGWGQTLLVMLSVPFAVAGSVWLLSVMDYNLSTAVWVGLIAVAGVATQTVIVVVVYLDQEIDTAVRERRLVTEQNFNDALVTGAIRGVRPMIMTAATTILGLAPLLWQSGVGADLSARTAAPVVGGMAACVFLTLMVIPAAYAWWRHNQWRQGHLTGSSISG
jgi:Cu(I)/Ag(I) efflux system membrane protein CusA/SilA